MKGEDWTRSLIDHAPDPVIVRVVCHRCGNRVIGTVHRNAASGRIYIAVKLRGAPAGQFGLDVQVRRLAAGAARLRVLAVRSGRVCGAPDCAGRVTHDLRVGNTPVFLGCEEHAQAFARDLMGRAAAGSITGHPKERVPESRSMTIIDFDPSFPIDEGFRCERHGYAELSGADMADAIVAADPQSPSTVRVHPTR